MTILNEDSLAYMMSGGKRDPFATRRAFAQKLAMQGTDTSPVQSPWQGVGRLAQALAGAYGTYRADADEKQAKDDLATKIADAGKLTDPVERLNAFSAINPEIGLRYSAQSAADEIKQAAERENARGGAEAMRRGYGVPMGGTQQAAGPPAMAPAAAQAEAQKKIQYLVNTHGLSPEVATTMVGNLFQESNFNPTAVHDGGTGYGLAGWRLDRRDALVKEAQARGEDPANPTVQLDFLANELKTRPEYQKLQAAQTPDQRQAAAMDYFRPAGYTPNNPQGGLGYVQRQQYAQQFAQPGRPPAPNPGVVNGPTMLAQGDTTRPTADASGTPLPPTMPQRAPEIGRPDADPALVARLSDMVERRRMTMAEADKQINDDINRRWTFAQTQASEDRRQQLAIQTEDRKQQGALDRAGSEAFIKGTADRYVKDVRPKAENAISEINGIHQIRQLLDAGAITGTGADARVFTAKLGELLGIPSEQAANTQVLQSALAARVISGMGGSLGAGFSNADRDFVERAKGGQITMTEPALRRLIDIGERQSRMAVDAHGKEVARLGAVRGLSTMGKDFFTLPPVQDYATWREANPLAPVMPPAAGAPGGNSSNLPPLPPGFRILK